MDCFVVSLLAMTKGDGCGLLRSARNDEGVKGSIHKLVIARVRRTRGNLVILGLSLREPKVRGNLVMATATPNPHCHCDGLKSL